MGLLLGLSNAIKRVLEVIAFASGWLLIVLMCITCIDVVGRKLGIPIPLTKFQELEWYMHTAIFSMWMGYNYTINAHPRVDSYTETLRVPHQGLDRALRLPAVRAPLHLPAGPSRLGLRLDLLPAERALRRTRSASSTAGSSRACSTSACGCCSLGIVSVLLRLIVFLFGRRPQSEVELQIGHAELEV